MKKLSILLALALVVALTGPAVAEVEEITVGGSIQIRGQILTPGVALAGEFDEAFNDDVNSLDWVTQRTRVNVDAKLSGGVRGFVELQSYDLWGVDEFGEFEFDNVSSFDPEAQNWQRPFGSLLAGNGNDEVGLYQAYIEMNDIADYPLMVRIGRQELVYGREWLVGNNDAGLNFAGLSFDAIKASYETDMFRVDAWWSKLVELTSPPVSAVIGEVEEDGDIDFYGVYGTYKGLDNIAIDGYWLFVRNADNTVNLFSADDTGDTDGLHTVGARGAGMWELGPGMLDASIEAAFQFGDNDVADAGGSSGDYEGWAFNAMGGYTFDDVQWSPRLEAEYAYFSGDDDAADEDTEEFVRLFSDVHYGELNLGGAFDQNASNLHILRIGGSIVPVEKLTVKADFYYFMLAEDDDDGLGKTFGVLQNTADVDDDVGYEINLVADYQYTEDLNLRLGWAHFFADDAIENSWGFDGVDTNDDDVDYIYVQALLVF